ncbi:hypothetical protein [Burkholderia ubonensis]|uniref:Uncharacterized protein n=1 Tax=Burkholderia ubonensis TaxID=101571 RepID=A0ABD4E5Y9_9BURK|nr:hypothetical protein [Burkholderia ubonensis]KVN88692.1 hypothetical protein WJ68_05890 [Burkholderia ubonensis]KVZ72394.1 hypothetical protein WL19_17240 [Burkholderia ubonensis]KVZ87494.1 hypothetical protein WL24_06295 [Burkholderia ubonensis]
MNDDVSYWQNVVGPVAAALITSTLALGGISWQLSRQEAQAERVRFIDGAQATAQETSRLLNDGYNELTKMVNASHNKGWKEFSELSWRDYMDFHRRWREQLIVEHFKLVRYFGKRMADNLIHVDEIDLHPVGDISSPSPCMPAGGKGDLDIAKLAFVTECTTRIAAVTQDIIDDDIANKRTDDVMASIQEHSKQEDVESQLLDDYEKSTVRYLRALDETLTQLGDPQVTVVTRSSRT